MENKDSQKDLDLFVRLVNKCQRENEEKYIQVGEERIPIHRFSKEDFYDESQEDFVFPTYYPVESQEMMVRETRAIEVAEPPKVPINFGLTAMDKLKIIGGATLALVIGLGILKLSNARDEAMFSSDGYKSYQEYVDYARANGLPISEEGFSEYMGYDYENNTISLDGSSKGGR